VAERRLAEVGQIAREYAAGDSGAVERDDLQALLDHQDVLVIDVRPKLEFDSGHLPGARAIPVEELPARLTELPRDKRIVAYCRGAYCLFADEAVALLRREGFDARRLEGGWSEWLAEDRPTVAGAG
jgi:rhodanese-related sulfurtransferase